MERLTLDELNYLETVVNEMPNQRSIKFDILKLIEEVKEFRNIIQ